MSGGGQLRTSALQQVSLLVEFLLKPLNIASKPMIVSAEFLFGTDAAMVVKSESSAAASAEKVQIRACRRPFLWRAKPR